MRITSLIPSDFSGATSIHPQVIDDSIKDTGALKGRYLLVSERMNRNHAHAAKQRPRGETKERNNQNRKEPQGTHRQREENQESEGLPKDQGKPKKQNKEHKRKPKKKPQKAPEESQKEPWMKRIGIDVHDKQDRDP